MTVKSYPRQLPKDWQLVFCEATGEFRSRAFSDYQNIQRIAARDKCLFQTRQQHHEKYRGHDGQPDAQRGHGGKTAAKFHVADVVANWYRHRNAFTRCVSSLPQFPCAKRYKPGSRNSKIL